MSQSKVMDGKVKSVGTYSKTVGVSFGNSDQKSTVFGTSTRFLVTIGAFKINASRKFSRRRDIM